MSSLIPSYRYFASYPIWIQGKGTIFFTFTQIYLHFVFVYERKVLPSLNDLVDALSKSVRI